ncbi:MAG TPA: hypothetical protein VGB30_01555 [bacterium]
MSIFWVALTNKFVNATDLSGDEKIGFRHRISDGFMGRIPLEE